MKAALNRFDGAMNNPRPVQDGPAAICVVTRRCDCCKASRSVLGGYQRRVLGRHGLWQVLFVCRDCRYGRAA